MTPIILKRSGYSGELAPGPTGELPKDVRHSPQTVAHVTTKDGEFRAALEYARASYDSPSGTVHLHVSNVQDTEVVINRVKMRYLSVSFEASLPDNMLHAPKGLEWAPRKGRWFDSYYISRPSFEGEVSFAARDKGQKILMEVIKAFTDSDLCTELIKQAVDLHMDLKMRDSYQKLVTAQHHYDQDRTLWGYMRKAVHFPPKAGK